jgi:NAD(P)-dependent dehydrogenase (short-subunit alcohol dehydrogenase family)
MRIIVTGGSRLAAHLIDRFMVEGMRVEDKVNKMDYDIFINNAHVDFKQCDLLYEWFQEWKDLDTKHIINISSRAGLPNLSKGYLYGAQKAALDHLADNLTFNSNKKCKITTIGLGMLEDELPSLKYKEVGDLIEYIIQLPNHLEINKVLLQHVNNYQEIQTLKAKRY